MEKDYQHIPVLLNEAIEQLQIKPDGIYIDCTLGGGGHSSAILAKLTTGLLIAFDQDEYAIGVADAKLAKIGTNYKIVNNNFVNLKAELQNLRIEKVDGILYDLGVSSFQFDIPERGFSYNYDAPLDMRMDQNALLSAYQIVNEYDEAALKKIFYEYGEEHFAPQIAHKIVKARAIKPISTTFELVEIIKSALPAAILRKPSHPAKQVFQAIRIEVNKELSVFKASLEQALSLLNSHGRICVISFHSLEDRICKQIFKKVTSVNIPSGVPFTPKEYEPKFILPIRKTIVASDLELANNKRAHSAKLRVIEKI